MFTAETLRRRVDDLRESPAFRNYQVVRDRVLRINEIGRGQGARDASEYWKEELANFEYLLDAPPLVVDQLRRHSYHITGLRVHDYRSNRDAYCGKLAGKLAALRKVGGRDLFVPESPALGGFGCDIDGRLVNIDTLKFYEVLIALQKGSVLDEFRSPDPAERRLVWEIGAGWGGFPYQFKTVCPNTTYVITDFPELFLFSATYLLTLFPAAKVWFFGDTTVDELWARWESYDFVFLPNWALTSMVPPRLDLTINMVSFQEMTTEQVQGYVAHAAERECRFLYSLNRDRSPYNPQLSSVSEILAERYWPHEIEVLGVSYTKMLDHPAAKRDKRAEGDYRHIIGWRRIAS